MAKLEIKSDKIMPFGGIFPVIRKFSTIENMIDAEFGVRARCVGYQYGEILRTMMCNYLCGDRVEDIKIYQQGIEYMPGMKLCSPDTVLRAINELTEKDIVYEAESGKAYSFNAAERLNTVMVKAAITHRLIRPGRQYILDFDHEFMEAEKYDALHTYKGFRGYSPGVAVLTDKVTGDDVIVGVENRDGNANVKFHQADTLNRIFSRLDAQGIWTMVIRCDCGSYSKEIIEAIQNHRHKFYIRANMYGALRTQLREDRREWRKVTVGDQEMEVCSLPFISIEGISHCRLVVQRTPNPNGEADLFDGRWTYRAILTNDFDANEEDIIAFYNQRGSKERVLDQAVTVPGVLAPGVKVISEFSHVVFRQ